MRTIRRRSRPELPRPIVAEVEQRLGVAVTSFSPRRGGFSDGVAGVAVLDGGGREFGDSGQEFGDGGQEFGDGGREFGDGGRVFVKAVPGHAAFAGDYRFEAVVSAALPAGVPTPRLLFSCEVAGWVLLCSEVAPGRVAHEPWRPHELSAALDMLATCARELTPAPLGGLPTLAARMAGRCELWHDLAAASAPGPATGTPPAVATGGVGPWERAHLPRLAAVERTWADLVTGDTLLHFDPRFDNILIDAHGTARLVDWGRACVGPAWADLVCLLLESDLGAIDPQEVFTRHSLGGQAPGERVDALLVALLGYWTRTAAIPAHPSHLRERREHSRRATLEWLRSRWSNEKCVRDRVSRNGW
ncbi:phosphotransferase family protein [Nonomuraea sp. 3N208]|uniref:phosphotransferase family protein n=1 Tax=Nonomuraea sp. 3N208 TaxID=3457421 RepID=UPI003FCED381